MPNRKTLFVVSDIHGHYTLLKEALDAVGFDRESGGHLLVCCGDYFDRGDENVEVLKFFERLDRAVLLRGNHEDMLLKLLLDGKVLDHHRINGTMRTLENFFGKYFIDPVDNSIDFSGHNRTADRLCDFIEHTVNYFETKNYVFVHGWLPSGALTAEARAAASDAAWEKARWIQWSKLYNGQRPLADKTLVCGHAPTFHAVKFDPSRSARCGDIFAVDGLTAIDAGTADSKQINVLVIEDELL